MLRDPIELYAYPREWCCDKGIVEKVKSGLYILTKDGFLRRGITTATTACAAINAAIASTRGEVDSVEVLTPVGLRVRVEVDAEKGVASARKFAGDHEFDVTDGIEVVAKLGGKGIVFGSGIGSIRGRKAVSRAAMRQIVDNFRKYAARYRYRGGVVVEVPDGERIAKRTKNEKLGILGGISILGTTGFVEPWCRKLVETKIEIAKQYDKIVVATGRKAWQYALKKYRGYQPFVFGVHIDDVLEKHPGEKVVVGFPGLLSMWAGGRDKIEEKVARYGARVEVLEDAACSWGWNLQRAHN